LGEIYVLAKKITAKLKQDLTLKKGIFGKGVSGAGEKWSCKNGLLVKLACTFTLLAEGKVGSTFGEKGVQI